MLNVMTQIPFCWDLALQIQDMTLNRKFLQSPLQDNQLSLWNLLGMCMYVCLYMCVRVHVHAHTRREKAENNLSDHFSGVITFVFSETGVSLAWKSLCRLERLPAATGTLLALTSSTLGLYSRAATPGFFRRVLRIQTRALAAPICLPAITFSQTSVVISLYPQLWKHYKC